MCEVVRFQGVTAVVCGRFRSSRPKACAECMRLALETHRPPAPGILLCDQPLANGKTCDEPMCREHAKEVGEDRHLCVPHASLAPQLALFGAPQPAAMQ